MHNLQADQQQIVMPDAAAGGCSGGSTNCTLPRMDLRLTISTLSFNMALPLLGVGLVTLLLSLCFCCYLCKSVIVCSVFASQP